MKFTALISVSDDGIFVRMPMFWQRAPKDIRDDLLDTFRSLGGEFVPTSGSWCFAMAKRSELLSCLAFFKVDANVAENLSVTPGMIQAPSLSPIIPANPGIFSRPSGIQAQTNLSMILPLPSGNISHGQQRKVISPLGDKKIIVSVPADIHGPRTMQRVVATQIAKLETEFLRLHKETGLNKTQMREILSHAVPGINTKANAQQTVVSK